MNGDISSAPESWNQYTWAQLFRAVVNFTAQPSENLDDIVVGGFVLGERRANLLDRGFEAWQDVPHALSIFCWWPIKPSLSMGSRNYLIERRGLLFSGAFRDTNVHERIIKVVPNELLRLETYRLFELLQRTPIEELIHWDDTLNK